MRRLVLVLATVVLGAASFFVGRTQGTVYLSPPPAHLPTAPADEDEVRWAARADVDLPERRDVALRVLGFLGHPEDADLLWRRSLDADADGALATSLLGRVSHDPAHRDRLLDLASDPDAMHRTAAIEALGDLGAEGIQRLVALGDLDGVVAGLARSRGRNASSRMLAFASRFNGGLGLIQRDARSLELLEGAQRLEALALHDPASARRRLDDRILDGKLDDTTRSMIQALPPHGPWLDRILVADAPLADRAEILLHFDPVHRTVLLDELRRADDPDPEAALLLYGPSSEAFRHAEAAMDLPMMMQIVTAEWRPGQVPDELVSLVLSSEAFREDWLHVPDFLATAATDAALDRLFEGATVSPLGTGWIHAIATLPDPDGPVLMWAVVDASPSSAARNEVLALLVERGSEHLERALGTLRAELGTTDPGIGTAARILLERGTLQDENAVLDLCVDGTRTECQWAVSVVKRWSVVDRLVAIAEGADDRTRATILATALVEGHLDERVHTWIGDADPVVAGAALERLPEVAGDDLTSQLLAELPQTDPEYHRRIVGELRRRDLDAAAAAVRGLPDPSKGLIAFSGHQDPVSRALREEFASDARPDVRAAALRGMRLGSRDEEERCRAALADPVARVRTAAASCVGWPRTTHAAKQLAAAYRTHRHPEILEELKAIGGPHADAFR